MQTPNCPRYESRNLMQRNMSSHKTPLVSSLIAAGLGLQALGTVYKPEALGYFAASPGVPLLFIASIVALPLKGRGRVSTYTWCLILWGLVGSAFSLMYFGWNDLYGSKFMPLMILSIAWLSPLLCFHALSIGTLRIGLAIGLTICLVGYILSDILAGAIPAIVRAMIFGGDALLYYDDRPRAFMAEPSHFATILGRYALFLYLLYEAGRPLNRTRLTLSMIALAVVLLFTGSKGGALAVSLTLLLLVMNRRTIGFAVFLIPVGWWLATFQINAIATDLDRFTSTATRAGMWLAGSAATLVNPVGWGYYGVYGTVSTFGNWSMDVLFGLPLRLTELQTIVGDLTSVSYKTTILDFAVTFGWPFFALMVWCLRRIDLSDLRALCAVTFIVMSGLYTSGHESVGLFLGIALLMKFFPAASVGRRQALRLRQMTQRSASRAGWLPNGR